MYSTAAQPPTMPRPGTAPAATGPAPAPGGNIFNTSANALNTGIGAVLQSLRGPNIGQFFNPFTSEVTARTMGDMDRARMTALNDVGAQATRAGAFGGDRHGLVEATVNSDFVRDAGNMAAGLNMQGFNTALGAGQQQQQQQIAAGGQLGNLSGIGFGMGQQLNQNLAADGASQQALLQSIINAARGQFGGYTGQPQQGLAAFLAALGAAQTGQQTTTETRNPGLLDLVKFIPGFGG